MLFVYCLFVNSGSRKPFPSISTNSSRLVSVNLRNLILKGNLRDFEFTRIRAKSSIILCFYVSFLHILLFLVCIQLIVYKFDNCKYTIILWFTANYNYFG